MMFAGLATAWNLLGGFAGYLSLGNAAFFGVGAYAIAHRFPVGRRAARLRPVRRASAGGARRGLAGVADRLGRVPHPGGHLRDSHDLDAVRRADACARPAVADERCARDGRGRSAVPRGDVRAAVLLGARRDLFGRARRVLVRAAGETRSHAVRDPRRRGSCARCRCAHRAREARDLRDRPRDHRDDRRRLGLLHHVHLSAVRDRSARDDRHGADGLPRWPRHAVGAAPRSRPAGTDPAAPGAECIDATAGTSSCTRPCS